MRVRLLAVCAAAAIPWAAAGQQTAPCSGTTAVAATTSTTAAIRAPLGRLAARNARHAEVAPHLPAGLQSVPPTPADASTKRGFDDHGDPYIDVLLPDGTIKRMQSRGVALIKPDGTTTFVPTMSLHSHVQHPTPPELPNDPRRGRAWIESHNEDLLAVITKLVGDDTAEMAKFSKAEEAAAGDDLFKQIVYRTNVATFLAGSR